MKNGFTLIELLAVIVILSIILLIAMPIVNNLVEEAKKSAFKDTGYGIISASEILLAKNTVENNPTDIAITITYGNSVSVPANNLLEMSGDIPENGLINIKKDGSVSFSLYDGKYCLIKSYGMKRLEITEMTKQECLDRLAIVNTAPVAVIEVTPAVNFRVDNVIAWSFANSVLAGDKEIDKYEWQNKQDVYEEAGTYIVKLRVKDDYDMWSEWVTKEIIVTEEPIVFGGAGVEAFDANSATSVPVSTTGVSLNWTGNIPGKLLEIDVASSSFQTIYIRVLNSSGVPMFFLDPDTNTSVNVLSLYGNTRKTFRLIPPAGTASISVAAATSSYSGGALYEVSSPNLGKPGKVTGIAATPTEENVTLNWTNPAGVVGADVYINGTYASTVTGSSYVAKPLYSDTTYNFTLYSIRDDGNRGLGATFAQKTVTGEVNWKGLNAGAYDSDNTTYYAFDHTGVISTWEGSIESKVINVDLFASSYQTSRVSFLDSNNVVLPFVNLNTGLTINSYDVYNGRGQARLQVPAGAAKISLSTQTSSYGEGRIYRLHQE